MNQPWLTIVTVVRDDLDGLARTVQSVASCDRDGVEYLIVDSSVDANAVRSLAGTVAQVQWIEPHGIYPAMNHGLTQATGAYVQFLNAGDVLHDTNVLERIRKATADHPAWMFGPVEIVEPDGSRVLTPQWDYIAQKRSLFSRGFFPQHQGTIMSTELLRSVGGFDERYTVAADYAAFLRVSRVADPLILDFVVADFYEGGSSSSHWLTSLREFHQARLEILAPRGSARLREEVNTGQHFAKMWTYRNVVAPLRSWLK